MFKLRLFLAMLVAFPCGASSASTTLTPCEEASIQAVLMRSSEGAAKITSAHSDCVFLDPLTVEELLRTAPSAVRKELINRAATWDSLLFSPVDIGAGVALLLIALLAMAWGYARRDFTNEARCAEPWGTGKETSWRFVIDWKRRRFPTLLLRDVGPLSFDVSMHQDRAEISEYRGAIHWFRDVSEKLLAVVLIFIFYVFLARAVSYGIHYVSGEGWRLLLLPIDVNIAVTMVGFALIIDGFVIVSTMTDAPGIGRTLDAVIVILAGYVVMLVEAQPGGFALVSFTVGRDPWLAPLLAFMIAILFIVRWIVRHHTLHELRGMPALETLPAIAQSPAGDTANGSQPKCREPEPK